MVKEKVRFTGDIAGLLNDLSKLAQENTTSAGAAILILRLAADHLDFAVNFETMKCAMNIAGSSIIPESLKN